MPTDFAFHFPGHRLWLELPPRSHSPRVPQLRSRYRVVSAQYIYILKYLDVSLLMSDLIRSKECLGLHKGTAEPANLGDGNGWVNERVRLTYKLSPKIMNLVLFRKSSVSITTFQSWARASRVWLAVTTFGEDKSIFSGC